MMFFRKTIMLLFILIVTVGTYWYFEIKEEKKEVSKEKSASLFEPSDRQIVTIILKKKGNPDIVLEKKLKEAVANKEDGKEQGKWIISSPVKTGGDSYTIDAIVNSLKEGRNGEVVWGNLEKENDYELNNPRFSLRFYYEEEDAVYGIDFGIESLDRKRDFVKVFGKNKIFTIPTEIRNSLDKNLFDLRNKRICPCSGDDIVGITLFSPMESFVLHKEDSEWYFMPERIKASKRRIDTYTGTVRWGSFETVEEESSTSFVKYGLDKPLLKLKFELRDNSAILLVVGNPVTGSNAQSYYAMRSSDGMIFQVRSRFVNNLMKSKFELKDRRIFDISEKDVRVVKLEKDGTTYSFVRNDDEWELSDTGEKLEHGYKIDNIVRSITTAEYEEKAPIKRGDKDYPATNIESTKYIVTFTCENNKPPLTVKLTEKNEETGKLCLTPDDGNTVYYTNGYFLSNFPDKREDFLK